MRKLPLASLGLALIVAALMPGRFGAQENATPEDPGPDTVVFTARRGTVTFAHRAHGEQFQCTTCHHESRPEKPLESQQQACRGCHTNPAEAPMTTSLRLAMHDTPNRTGLCMDCHAEQSQQGKEAAVTECSACHIRQEQ